MNKDEEMIYSSMGLDPILLLEKPPSSENYMVHIIRPGEEEGKSKENKNTILLQNKEPIEKGSDNYIDVENIKGNEEEESNLDLEKETSQLINSDQISITEKNELNPTETKEADEDPRRKRRRSSASS